MTYWADTPSLCIFGTKFFFTVLHSCFLWIGIVLLGKAVVILRESMLMGNMHFPPLHNSPFIVPAVAFSQLFINLIFGIYNKTVKFIFVMR